MVRSTFTITPLWYVSVLPHSHLHSSRLTSLLCLSCFFFSPLVDQHEHHMVRGWSEEVRGRWEQRKNPLGTSTNCLDLKVCPLPSSSLSLSPPLSSPSLSLSAPTLPMFSSFLVICLMILFLFFVILKQTLEHNV